MTIEGKEYGSVGHFRSENNVDETYLFRRLDLMLSVVSKVTGVSKEEICSSSRKMEVVNARHLYMYCARNEYQWATTTEIAGHVNRNHSSLIYACSQMESGIGLYVWMETQVSKVKRQYSEIWNQRLSQEAER